MSEAQSTRNTGSRGRGGFRGGRGGFRGGRTTSRTKREDNEQENIPPSDESGEMTELKRHFGDKIPFLQEVYPDWTDEDCVFALQETDGDIELTVDRISTGMSGCIPTLDSTNSATGSISQWSKVEKKHPKTKEAAPSSDTAPTRVRGRGNLEGRGRGRGADRGTRGARGARAASQANGGKHAHKQIEDGWSDPPAATTEAAGSWDSAPTNGDPAAAAAGANDTPQDTSSSWAIEEPKATAPSVVTPAAPAAAPTAKASNWAGLFAKPAPAPKPATSVPAAQREPPPTTVVSAPPVPDLSPEEALVPPPIEPQIVEDGPSELPSAPHSEAAVDIAPSQDELTETNLEQLPDESHPPASQTAASTVASTQDPLAQIDSTKAPVRPMSGYHATALKATGGAGRSASFVRKVMEQQEAVVMPGHQAVEKAAVQFGKMGLNGDGDVDVDEDREEPETRTQLPDDSPAAPRASLPPSLHEAQAQPPVEPQLPIESQPAPQRQAPGLPPAPQQPQQTGLPAAPGFAESYRYGQPQKAYDPFGQQSTQAPPQGPSQEPFSNQVPGQSQPGSAQTDFSYYDSRYQQYYGGHGQAGDAQQRSGSAFGTSGQEAPSQYATARPQQAFGQQEAQTSGNNTPAPGMPTHQAQHSQHMGGQGSHGSYPYSYTGYNQQYPQYGQNYMTAQGHQYGSARPMFDDVRRQEEYYNNQYGYGHNQQRYNSYKSGMYAQPAQQYSYDQHSSSPATAGAFGGREVAYGGRSGSAQPSEGQQTGSSNHGFGNMPDPFGRASSGFGQHQAMSQQHGSHQASEEVQKATGPSPSMQGGRPGSTVNSSQGQQAGFPAQSQHSGQQAFGSNYPQYGGGFGNFGGQQNAHQGSNYGGGYGANAFGSYGSYGSGGRGWAH
jgi:hypothetical protein